MSHGTAIVTRGLPLYPKKKKVVCVLSGGMDSTTLLYDLVSKHFDVYPLTFDYGQKHNKEIEFARKSSEKLGLEHMVVDISSIQKLLQGSSLMVGGEDIPEGHYEQENMKSTVVPNRNMIMLSLSIGYAISIGANEVYYAAHGGDHAIYPDCRPIFVERMQDAAEVCDYEKIKIKAPYLKKSKGEIAKRGKKLKVPYEDTWTCYKGLDKACGKCGSCVERLEAFEFAGIEDPLEYEVN
jgi:7-cyano-7-deazaguanine synthase